MGYEQLSRMARLYGAQPTGPRFTDWADWEQDSMITRRWLRDTPLALADFNDTVRRCRLDEPHPLAYEAWLTFLAALHVGLHPLCDAYALADALAAVDAQESPPLPTMRNRTPRTTRKERE
jgi:hypothetical protein